MGASIELHSRFFYFADNGWGTSIAGALFANNLPNGFTTFSEDYGVPQSFCNKKIYPSTPSTLYQRPIAAQPQSLAAPFDVIAKVSHQPQRRLQQVFERHQPEPRQAAGP